MKKIRTFFLIILSTVFLSGCSSLQQTPSPLVFDDHQTMVVQLGNSKQLKLEIVNTPQSISQGLSGRDELGADGMLFVFDQPIIPQFWMKEMKFDLDIIWIKDMVVVEIVEGVPAPDLDIQINQLPIYSPSQLTDMVLEVEAGKVQKWKLKMGNEIIFLQLQ